MNDLRRYTNLQMEVQKLRNRGIKEDDPEMVLVVQWLHDLEKTMRKKYDLFDIVRQAQDLMEEDWARQDLQEEFEAHLEEQGRGY